MKMEDNFNLFFEEEKNHDIKINGKIKKIEDDLTKHGG
jgi:hypothetical protein